MLKRTPLRRALFRTNLYSRRLLDNTAFLLWMFAVVLLLLDYRIETGFQ